MTAQDAADRFSHPALTNLMELGHVQVLPLRRRHVARVGVSTVRLAVGSDATATIGWRGPRASHIRVRSSGRSAGSGRGLRGGGAGAYALPVEALGPAAAVSQWRDCLCARQSTGHIGPADRQAAVCLDQPTRVCEGPNACTTLQMMVAIKT